MANEQNLVRNEDRTPSERRENATKAGIASGEARRRKRDLRLALEALLEKDITDKNGITMSGAEAIAAKQFQKALKGDSRAFELVRDTTGQKPVERVEQLNIDAEYEQSVEYVRKLMENE